MTDFIDQEALEFRAPFVLVGARLVSQETVAHIS